MELAFKQPIIDAVMHADAAPNTALVGGYLRALHGRRDTSKWLLSIQELSQGPDAERFFPAVLMQSGITDEAATVLSDLVRRGTLPAYYLQGFIFGGEIRNLSPDAFASWISLLLAENDQLATIAALQLLHHYGKPDRLKEVSPDLIEAVLLHDTLFEKERAEHRGAHRDYDWSEVAREFLREHPEERVAFAKKLLENMGEDSVVLSRFGPSYAQQFLAQIAKELPSEVWAIAAPRLGPPIDWRAHTIKDWLRGSDLSFDETHAEAILSSVPPQGLWDWVDYHAFELGYLAHVYARTYLAAANDTDKTFCVYFRVLEVTNQTTINVLPDFMPPDKLEICRVRANGVDVTADRKPEIPNDFRISLAGLEGTASSDGMIELAVTFKALTASA